MARTSTLWTPQKVEQRRKDGFGQGTLSNYKAWLTVRDFSSIGTTTRLFSFKLNRVVTLFSNIERNTFLYCEHLSNFEDYWEQKDAELKHTLPIARDLRIKHPYDKDTGEPTIVTLDGVLTLSNRRPEVIDCKPEKELASRRTHEKLALRREYAKRMSYGYRLFTEHSIPRVVVHNLQWMRMSVGRPGARQGQIDDSVRFTTQFIEELCQAFTAGSQRPIGDFLSYTDGRVAAPVGHCLWALRRLFYGRWIEFDLTIPFRTLLLGSLGQLRISPDLHEPVTRARLAHHFELEAAGPDTDQG